MNEEKEQVESREMWMEKNVKWTDDGLIASVTDRKSERVTGEWAGEESQWLQAENVRDTST